MTQLSAESFRRAGSFVAEHARPLDAALLRFELGEGSRGEVLGELAKFQNPDGGFFGLEMDVRLPQSSPIATAIAFQYRRRIGATPSDDSAARALRYLRQSFDETRGIWFPVPPEVNLYPHAPWWERQGDTSEAGSRVNPTAEIAGYFLEAGDRTWVETLVTDCLHLLESLPDTLEMHDLLCFLRLAEALPPSLLAACEPKLQRAGSAIVTRDPALWSGYAVKPLWLAPSPTSLLTGPLGDILEKNLDWEIAAQNEDGSWSPNWSWESSDPSAWREAEREWKGFLTVRTLTSLIAYGRVNCS